MNRAAKWRAGAFLFLRACTCLAFALFALRSLLLGSVQQADASAPPAERPVFVPAPIGQVLEGNGRIYILYDSSSAVNVYDSTGSFLWSVSAPWHDHTGDSQIGAKDGSLFLWQDRYMIYQYDLETGEYQGSFRQIEHEAEFPARTPPSEQMPAAGLPEGRLCCSALTVYRKTAEGLVPVVARGGWVRLLFFGNIWLIGFSSLLIQVLWGMLDEPRRKWRETAVSLETGEARRSAPQARTPKAKRMCMLARGMVALSVLYAAAVLAAAGLFHSAILFIGIMPLAVCFILLGICLYNASVPCGEDAYAVQLWIARMWAAMFAAFFAVVAGMALI